MAINNLLASPGFAAWTAGRAARHRRACCARRRASRASSIFSIAHLDDAERMFFVTLLLNEVLAWMRTQSGTSSLRALLYMDEIFGFFPPVGESAVEAAAAHAAEAGARVRPRRRARDAEPGRPRLQGALEHRHLVARPPADRARQGSACSTASKGAADAAARRSIARRWSDALGPRQAACS